MSETKLPKGAVAESSAQFFRVRREGVALLGLAALAAALPDIAAAQDAAEEIIITGVRGAPRTVLESPTPIDVFSAEEIERNGRAGVLQALTTLAPSFNVPTRPGGGTATVISTGSLRGLNPDQTLVLVNGKRRHKTSLINSVSALYTGSVPVDLDLLATSSIARIEVLRDGAAAQYGSDAIAGVINIILKDNDEGGTVTTSFSQNYDRSDGDLYQAGANYGINLGEESFLNLSFGFKNQEDSNRAVPVARSVRIYPQIAGRDDPREANANRLITTNFGQLPQRGYNFAYNFQSPFEAAEFYSFGTFSHRHSELPFTVRLPNNVSTLPELYPEGFRPTQIIDETDYEGVLGLRGTFAGWDWDLSSLYGRNEADQSTEENLNASLGPTSPTEFKVGILRSSEWVTSLDLTRAVPVGGGELQVSFGAQHRKETYEVVRGDEAGFAAGAYVIPAGRPFAGQRPPPGAQATPSFRPEDESDTSRNNYAAYGELGWSPTERLFLGIAGRYEDYDDSSGDTFIGKATGRYEFTDTFSVRGAVNSGFRAPGLAQQNYASTTSQFRTVNGVPNVLLLIKTLPVNSPEAIALGAEPLTPEESLNYSAGFTLRPTNALTVTVDAYRIDVDDRIAITSTLTGTAVSAILVANRLNPNLSAQYFTNAIDTRTEGVDVVATYRLDLDARGRLVLSLGYNHNTTEIEAVKANPPELAALGAGFVLFDRASRSNLENSAPTDKIYLSANWDIGKFNVNTRTVRYGAYDILSNTPSLDESYGADWVTDLEVTYKLTDLLSATVGASNIANEYPDRARTGFNANLGSGQYPGRSPYGFTGGSWYVRLKADF
jgi:iron complex outermembrane receptor protein